MQGGVCACAQAKKCRVVMHPTCVGLDDIPEGRWFCPEHEHLAGAKRPKKEASNKGARNGKGEGRGAKGEGKARVKHEGGGKGSKKRVLQKGEALL